MSALIASGKKPGYGWIEDDDKKKKKKKKGSKDKDREESHLIKKKPSATTSSSSSNTHGSVSVQVIQEVIGGSTSDEPNEITEIQFDDGSSVAPLDEASNKRKSWRATQFNANILVEA